jgi:hypothetical protein
MRPLTRRQITWVLCAAVWLCASSAGAQSLPPKGTHPDATPPELGLKQATGHAPKAAATNLSMIQGAASMPKAASDYREPLRDPSVLGTAPLGFRSGSPAASGLAPSPPVIPIFPSDGSSRLERVSRGALEFAAKVALSIAAARTGMQTPVPPPSYPAYQPSSPVPVPMSVAANCQASDVDGAPTNCVVH